MMKEKTQTTTEDSKYIQQHLANERTFLAWIRTAIAITGIGFLIMNLHIRSSTHVLSTAAVQTIGILSVVTGICTIIFSTISYFQKAKQNQRANVLHLPSARVVFSNVNADDDAVVWLLFFHHFIE